MRFSSFLAIAVALLLSAAASASASGEKSFQRAFRAGTLSMLSGEYDRAIYIFSELGKLTEEPRVQLELGRALFLSGRFSEAKDVFQQVYYRTELPYAVRRSINFYLEQVDRRVGYFRPMLGLTYRTNPSAVTDETDFIVFGVPVELQQEAPTSALGLHYSAEGKLPLAAAGRIGILGTIDGILDDRTSASYRNGTLAASLESPNGATTVLAGSGFYAQGGEQITSPFLRGAYRQRFSNGNTLFTDLSITHLDYRQADYLDGWQVRAAGKYGFDLDAKTSVLPGGSISVTRAKDSGYHQAAIALTAQLVRSMPEIGVDAVLETSVERRAFEGDDPVFSGRRQEVYVTGAATIIGNRPWWRFFPAISFRYDERHSTLAFYEFDRMSVSADLLYRF
ncbi:surface lipoprotein assembly modifier [Pacificimonas sp. ICDLI1SI03]